MTTETMESSQRFAPSGDLELWTESFGRADDQAVLLVMGAWNQGIAWPDEFCFEIAQHGYYVVRYDHRDTGQSSFVDYRAIPYDLDAMTRDAVAVLNAYGIRRAHVIGMSLGGFLGQLLALDYPDRVLTLSLLMTSPDHRVAVAAMLGQPTTGLSLSSPTPELVAHFARMRQSPPKFTEEAIQNTVESWRLANGVGVPFEEPWTRRLVERSLGRARNPLSPLNHTWAMAASGGRTERLARITAPTLVIHGQQDPLFPVDHGMAMAEAIPGAKLVVMPDMGHMLSPRLSGRIAEEVLRHVGQVPAAA